MGLVVSFTFAMSALSLLVMYLGYFSKSEVLKTFPKVLVIAYLLVYSSVWLSSRDEVNLKVDGLHSSRYQVFQSRKDLMMKFYGVTGSSSEEDESNCFFYSVNGKVIAVPLKSFELIDYAYIVPTTHFVTENYRLVGKHSYYFNVSLPRHREYLEVTDYAGQVRRIYQHLEH